MGVGKRDILPHTVDGPPHGSPVRTESTILSPRLGLFDCLLSLTHSFAVGWVLSPLPRLMTGRKRRAPSVEIALVEIRGGEVQFHLLPWLRETAPAEACWRG